MASLKFEVRGLNQLKLLNALKKDGVVVKNLLRANQKTMQFDIKSSDMSKAVSLMDDMGFEHEVISETSFKKSLKSALPRLGLPLGIVFMTIIAVMASGFLWKIEVSGNDRVDELTVIRALKESGISVGHRKDFSAETVEATLMELADISAVSARIVGTTLKVDIVESSVVTPDKEIGDVISLYDAEITRIIVNNGSSKVKIGDRVPAGATLIEGVEYNTAGEPIKTVDAQGNVYGKVNFTYTETAPLFGGYARTGKVTKSTVLQLFGLTIGKHKVFEGAYETEKTVTRIGSFFPFYAETISCYELCELPEKTLDELTQSVIDKAENNLIIKAGGSPISTTANVAAVADKVYKITVHIEAEVSIGGKRND